MGGLSIPSIVKTITGALGNNDAKIQKAKNSAEDFESVFLGQILNTMSEGLGDGLSGDMQEQGFGGGSAETQWRTLMNEYTAQTVTKSGGIGLSDSIMKEILRAQGA